MSPDNYYAQFIREFQEFTPERAAENPVDTPEPTPKKRSRRSRKSAASRRVGTVSNSFKIVPPKKRRIYRKIPRVTLKAKKRAKVELPVGSEDRRSLLPPVFSFNKFGQFGDPEHVSTFPKFGSTNEGFEKPERDPEVENPERNLGGNDNKEPLEIFPKNPQGFIVTTGPLQAELEVSDESFELEPAKTEICYYYNTFTGCSKGDKCNYEHVSVFMPNFTPKTTSFGTYLESNMENSHFHDSNDVNRKTMTHVHEHSHVHEHVHAYSHKHAYSHEQTHVHGSGFSGSSDVSTSLSSDSFHRDYHSDSNGKKINDDDEWIGGYLCYWVPSFWRRNGTRVRGFWRRYPNQ